MSYPDSPAPPLHSGSNANTRGLLTRRHSPYALARTVIGPPPAPSKYASVAVSRETSAPPAFCTSDTSTIVSRSCEGCAQQPCVSSEPRETLTVETAPVRRFEKISAAESAASSHGQTNGADLSSTVSQRRMSDCVRTIVAEVCTGQNDTTATPTAASRPKIRTTNLCLLAFLSPVDLVEFIDFWSNIISKSSHYAQVDGNFLAWRTGGSVRFQWRKFGILCGNQSEGNHQ